MASSQPIKTQNISGIFSNYLIVNLVFIAKEKQNSNMKAVIVVFAVTIVAVLGGITDEQKAKLKQYKESCIIESGVDPIVVENAKNGQVAEGDEKLACFGNCILKKLGIINANGDIDWEVARSKVPPGISQEQIDHVYNKCQNVAGSGCEKGANLLKCFKENKNFAVLS
ncbi:general odorant-binding protein 56a [Camponotus floridanus]|uniref:general odorant-binding protein 56a n=1 Tax=Camponotus floridanus TaxID=104421 RepID=UPI000DC6C77B|nr:general odorant-binding protein 56a [Camponotus floridanus]